MNPEYTRGVSNVRYGFESYKVIKPRKIIRHLTNMLKKT